MISYRPVLVLAASVVATTACGESNSSGGSGGSGTLGSGGVVATGGGSSSGGVASTGGGVGSGGLPQGTGGGGPGTGGAPTTGGAGPGTGGSPGTGGTTPAGEDGPCDIYNAAGNECVAAYSTVRRLLSTYTGPLYQVRSGSSEYNIGGNVVTNPQQAIAPKNGTTIPYQTSPQAGTLIDIPQTADGFADGAAQVAACTGTTCTIAKIYDQSGRGNDLTVAKGGRPDGGDWAAMDDFETIADAGPITVGGRNVYSLFMEARQGYRMTAAGNGMAVGDEAQGMYMLADGTRAGGACCWDFGNVTPDPTAYAEMNTLLFGIAYWGRGAGSGPWYGADFEAGVWMGGSEPGDPGWGGLDDAADAPANNENPALKVKHALGFLKSGPNPEKYALRMADIATATEVHTAYAGNYPSTKSLDSKGAVVIGVGGDNSNNSWGTFYEGAIVLGYPEDATEQAVLENIKAVGYTP